MLGKKTFYSAAKLRVHQAEVCYKIAPLQRVLHISKIKRVERPRPGRNKIPTPLPTEEEYLKNKEKREEENSSDTTEKEQEQKDNTDKPKAEPTDDSSS